MFKTTCLQHRAARIVTGIFDFINFRGANLMENLGWHSFDKQRDYFTATMMFKCINGLAPLRLTNELSVIGDALQLIPEHPVMAISLSLCLM